MDLLMNIVTLGVNDPERMVDWYREKFGCNPVRSRDGRIFFRLGNTFLFLVHATDMARELYIWEDGYGFKKFILTITFGSEEEVDRIFDELQQKKVTILKEPGRTPGGVYRGYITDPEDNCWELACYPLIEWTGQASSYHYPTISQS